MGEGFMKNLKKQIVILLILIISLMSIACDSRAEDYEESNTEHVEEREAADSTSDENKDSYLTKLDEIANQIVNDDTSVQKILNKAYASHGDLVENIYYADHEGKMFLSPPLHLPEDYDARERPWYKNALGKELYQPAPYHDQTVDKNIQTIAKALYKGDALIGVIGIDYALEEHQEVEKLDTPDEVWEEKSLLSTKEKEKLKNYAKDLGRLVETESDLDALKSHFDEQVKKGINGAQTIYLSSEDEIFLISPYIQLPDNYDPSIRPWYEAAVEESIYVSDTYIDAASNHTIVTVSTKVELENDSIGVLGIDFIIDL